MLLIDIKFAAPVPHCPVGISGPSEPFRLNLHSETGVAPQKLLTCLRAVLIAVVNRDQDVEIWVGLGPQALQRDRQVIPSPVDRHADRDERTVHLLPAKMRSAHKSPKYGAIVSLPGSTEWKRPSDVTPISNRRCSSLSES